MMSSIGLPVRLCLICCVNFLLLIPGGRHWTLADERVEQTVKDSSGQITAKQIEFFESKIRPVLVKHCYICHSAEAESVKGGLWLDSHPGLLEGGDSGPSIVPGDADASLLLESMRYESYEMPPEGQLPEHVLDDFARWIAMGAPDPRTTNTKSSTVKGIDWEQAQQFWAFQSVQAPSLPASISPDSPEAIDHFIYQKLTEHELTAQPQATEEVLLRRIYYDLTGLAPTLEEQRLYFNSDPQTRWANLIDRLLASGDYAEHWGRKWLDVVRYADSNGSDFNATFYDAWRYRNYVIDSFAQDIPFNEFARQQIAGDLMTAETDAQKRQQIIATGFLAIGPKMLSERNKEKLTFDVVDEQIDSMGKVFLGLTLGCARCHDHKFDPIPTKDYYALAGIFTSTKTLEGEMQQYVSDWVKPQLPLLPTEQQLITQFDQKIAKATQQLSQLKAKQKDLTQEMSVLQGDAREWILDNDSLTLTGEWVESAFSKYRYGKNYIHDNNTAKGTKSALWEVKQLPAGTYHIALAYNGGSARADKIPLTISWQQDGSEKSEALTYSQKRNPTTENLFDQLATITINAQTDLQVKIETTGSQGYVIVDALKVTDANPVTQLAAEDRERLEHLKQSTNALQQQITEASEALKTLKSKKPDLPTALAVTEAEEQGDCEICIRGEVAHRGERVPRGVLTVIAGEASAFVQPQGSGRLELANWIASPDNPLTARVIVNRVWMHLFGKGIVTTVDNFGELGARPTHPELLDHLASQFIEHNWSIKQLIRSILKTDVYQRSSAVSTKLASDDPENAWIARAERRRLTAESIRDTLLKVTGRLAAPKDGSPVANLKQIAVNNNGDGSLGSDVKAAERTVYLPVVRNELAPFLVAFDFADPDMVVGARARTNVPSQALLLMNNPFIIEQAQLLASQTAPKTQQAEVIEQHLDSLYQRLLVRSPTSDELSVLRSFYQSSEEQTELRWQTIVQSLIASTYFRLLD